MYQKPNESSEIKEWPKENWPERLFEIPEPPKKLFIRCLAELEKPNIANPTHSTNFTNPFSHKQKILCVVGSRKYTSYGKQVCESLIAGLAGYPITIISGLALGIDCIAHEAALKAKLQTIAVPGSGLDDKALYPRSNLGLAKRILQSGGALISELAEKETANPGTFPRRNRIMVGLSETILIIEASKKSGTLITARLGLDYNREVLTVPGSIFSHGSEGPHFILKNGAHPITSSSDILEILGIKNEEIKIDARGNLQGLEKEIFEAIAEPKTRDELSKILPHRTQEINQTLTILELEDLIFEATGKIGRKQ